MKKIGKAVCLVAVLCMLVTMFVGCERKPGLYAWYGGRIDVDNVLKITVDVGDGAKSYDVPFETYRAVFIYLKGIVSDTVVDENGNAKIATKKEKTAAVKEVAEDTLVEYYSLVALGEKYGITVTEEDKQAYYDDYMKKLQAYIDEIDESQIDYKGTKEEYAEELYRKTLSLAGGMTPEYFEFTYYKNLLEKRLKLALSSDLDDYLSQSYYHYKQVVVLYTKGDSAAEEKARADIEAAYRKLLAGESVDAVISEYSNSDYMSELYFDAYGAIVGSSTGDSVNTITMNAVMALDTNEISDVISGDEDDRTGYFAVFQRLGFDLDFICGSDSRAKAMFEYSYVGASYATPHYDRYLTIKESYIQNSTCVPIDSKIYKRIAVNTLY